MNTTTIMDTIELAQLADRDIAAIGVLSRSTYFAIIDVVKAGLPFSCVVGMHDCIKMRRVLAYHKISDRMRQQVIDNGKVRLFFNIDKD